MNDVRILTAQTADARRLADLAAATFALACPPGTSDAAIADFVAAHLNEGRFVEYLGDETRTILIAELDGTAVGYTMLVSGEPHDADVARLLDRRPTVELSKVYVLASQHGSGPSHALMAATIEYIGNNHASSPSNSMWLGVNQLNARAIRFYERHGLRVVGEKAFLVGTELHHDFVMERVVDSEPAEA